MASRTPSFRHGAERRQGSECQIHVMELKRRERSERRLHVKEVNAVSTSKRGLSFCRL